MYDYQTKCPNCGGTSFTNNKGRVNHSLVFTCTNCYSRHAMCNCDYCGRIEPKKSFEDSNSGPYQLCPNCRD